MIVFQEKSFMHSLQQQDMILTGVRVKPVVKILIKIC